MAEPIPSQTMVTSGEFYRAKMPPSEPSNDQPGSGITAFGNSGQLAAQRSAGAAQTAKANAKAAAVVSAASGAVPGKIGR